MNKLLLPLCSLMVIVLCSCGKTSVHAVKTADSVNVINQGVPGNHTYDLLNRISNVINEKPDLVIVMVGTNDVIAGGATFAVYQTNLSKIIDSLKGTGSDVLLLTPPPAIAGNSYNLNISRLDSACSIIMLLSKLKNCGLVDINKGINQLLDAKNPPSLFLSDGLHPNAAGYVDIATMIYNYMQYKKPRKIKITCFGDSITFGLYLTGAGTSTGQTYPAVLKRMLN